MSEDIAIRVEGLGKQYYLGESVGGYRTLRDALSDSAARTVGRARRGSPAVEKARRRESIWALRDVSFDVRKGQVLGIIGRNGAGKSTLLKLLARVTEPTEGRAEVCGRVGSLLEVGTGFHPELTGRENTFLNGAILGMRRAEIAAKFDEIVEFADIDRFIDTPVKRYSSGMYLRLAFSVAAHLEPEILIVDEVLAVGDAEFQRKCLGKMSDVAQRGRTVLFVSHNMSAVLRLTEETLVIDAGRLLLRDRTPRAVDSYLSSGLAQTGERGWGDEPHAVAAAPFRPLRLRIVGIDGRPAEQVSAAQPFAIEFTYRLQEAISALRVGIYLSTSKGEPVFTSFDTDALDRFQALPVRPEGTYVSRCSVPGNTLNEGRFVVGVNASAFRLRSYFTDEYALAFTVDGTGAVGSQWGEQRGGPLRPALSWEIESAP
ncbi:MAG: ABC transporter ATP-binding protein [Anaerolineales bacterium]|nr:ABC transporter ATP-binding protein [Anaerolineales bacterium]